MQSTNSEYGSPYLATCYVTLINKTQFDAGFAHHLIPKDGVVPAIIDPHHESEPQEVSKTASNFCVLLAIRL